MCRLRFIVGALTLGIMGGILFLAAPGARAQVSTSAPIPVKASKAKTERFRGQVVHADSNSMVVRDRKNSRVIRTFTYSPTVQRKVGQLLRNGGYQYGDEVEIKFQPGQDIALDIKGKPSKPL